MDINILYQDTDLLVMDKPAGVITNRADTVKEETIQDWVEIKFKIQPPVGEPEYKIENEDFYNRSGIVHRLDKETSGCLIIAKTPDSFHKLQEAFKNHQVEKEYIALIKGKLVPKEGEIKAPIGRLPWNRQRFGVVPGGKEAQTKYLVKKYYKNSQDNFTLVQLKPTTGRTHQIRVHLKYIGFPIVGDYLYAGRKKQKQDRKWCKRVFLHATSIAFPHPQTNKVLTIISPLTEELNQVIHQLSPIVEQDDALRDKIISVS